MRPGVPEVHITDRHDAEVAAYHALAGQAVLGLILGLLAPLALVDPAFWSIPAFGTFFGGWAIRRIKNHAGELAGRKMALAGFTLSLLFAAMAPTDWFVYRWMVRSEARQFSALWFKCLTGDEPQKAYQLTLAPPSRRALDDRLWDFYRGAPRLREALEGYVQQPLVRTLLALGPRAQVRFNQTTKQTREKGNDQVEQLYAVTYEEEGQRKSFFVCVVMERLKLDNGDADWRVVQTDGSVRP